MNTTYNVRRLALGLTMGLTALALPRAGAVAIEVYKPGAAVAVGTLSLVGEYPPEDARARALVRLDGTCGTTPWTNLNIIISSGNLNGDYAERHSVGMKNAYSTLLTALLSGKTVEIEGIKSCNPGGWNAVFMNLWEGSVNIIK